MPRSQQYGRWPLLRPSLGPVSCRSDNEPERRYRPAAPREQAVDGHLAWSRFQRVRSTPLRARRPGLERTAEILGLTGYLLVFEFHDADRVGRPPVVSEGPRDRQRRLSAAL